MQTPELNKICDLSGSRARSGKLYQILRIQSARKSRFISKTHCFWRFWEVWKLTIWYNFPERSLDPGAAQYFLQLWVRVSLCLGWKYGVISQIGQVSDRDYQGNIKFTFEMKQKWHVIRRAKLKIDFLSLFVFGSLGFVLEIIKSPWLPRNDIVSVSVESAIWNPLCFPSVAEQGLREGVRHR